ncbi:Aste57867_4502 [Aphanomyces stellatus]|uniref:Aste57867_4502 protein n=1 Tax=Aphanomyces stellatus TaxID=120398 RepID=A0A485KD67_9STRA|nr:hypothetical protein As57867_004489 [Aphanomyces stellatus]VFT81612.1 Aste57867_4502 [Aphanomyces stellatus]
MNPIGVDEAKRWELTTLCVEDLHAKGRLEELHEWNGTLESMDERMNSHKAVWTNPHYVAFVGYWFRKLVAHGDVKETWNKRVAMVRNCRRVLMDAACPQRILQHGVEQLYKFGQRDPSFVIFALGVESFQYTTHSNAFRSAMQALHGLLLCMEGSGSSFETLYKELMDNDVSVQLSNVLNQSLFSPSAPLRSIGSKILYQIILDSTSDEAERVLNVLLDCAENEDGNDKVRAHTYGLAWEVLDVRRDLFCVEIWASISNSLRDSVSLVRNVAIFSVARMLFRENRLVLAVPMASQLQICQD